MTGFTIVTPPLGLVIWYVFMLALGLVTYPFIRLSFPGLTDKGYPLSRALGLLVLGYFSWMAGSTGIPYTRSTIAAILGLILVASAGLAYYQREEFFLAGPNNRDMATTSF